MLIFYELILKGNYLQISLKKNTRVVVYVSYKGAKYNVESFLKRLINILNKNIQKIKKKNNKPLKKKDLKLLSKTLFSFLKTLITL